ncbi:MAG: DUF1579 family protein [Thermoanaerobaculia bacterium]
MKPKILLSILLLTAAALASTAQEESTTTDEEPPIDPLNQLTQPGKHHEHLHRLAGDWDLTIKVWSSPDGEPIESPGTAEARWILDGRFLWTIYRAELFGQPFEAWSIEGYDNQAEQYVGTWRDTQGTYTLVYRGKCKLPPLAEGETHEETVPDGTYREMTTKLTDPTTLEKLDIRTELRILDDGDFVQESFIVLSPDVALKNLELIGTRRGEE